MPESSKLSPSVELHDMATGFRIAQALYVVAKLDVADLLADGPETSGDLARRLGVQPGPLFRVMRTLAAQGVFTQDASDRFGLTPLGEVLREDHPSSMRHFVIFVGEEQYRAFGELLHTVRTGETAFDHLYGRGHFDWLADQPEASATFNAAMAEGARIWGTPMADHSFTGRRLVVDVGGGRGHLIASILLANPGLRGILYDLPQGVAEAAAYLDSCGVAARCEIRTGSIFDSVPSGGDVYVLSRVLHDWSDEKARIILANCRRAIARDGVLLLRETVVPEGAAPSRSKQVDLIMLAMTGGRERTEAEWRAMLGAVGFALTKIMVTGGRFDLIEASPV